MGGGLLLALQGDEQDRVAASISRAVRDALVSILRCRAPQAQPWRPKVRGASPHAGPAARGKLMATLSAQHAVR